MQTALVTGATSGIGRDAARRLGADGWRVLVHGRDREAGRAAVRDIEDAGGEASFHRADFADLDAVRELADEVREATDGLDALCNNAGVYADYDRRAESAKGYQLVLAVNHLAPYLLTHDLVDHLAGDARVVTTSSDAHHSGGFDAEAVREGRTGHRGFRAYGDTKFFNVLFTRELARRLDGDRTANCFHPGAIPGSGFARGVRFPASLAWKALAYVPGVGDTVEGGGRALARLARGVDANGVYFDKTERSHPARSAQDERKAADLWDLSADLVGVDPGWP